MLRKRKEKSKRPVNMYPVQKCFSQVITLQKRIIGEITQFNNEDYILEESKSMKR